MKSYPNYPCIHDWKVEFTHGWDRWHPIKFEKDYSAAAFKWDNYMIFWWTSLFEVVGVRV